MGLRGAPHDHLIALDKAEEAEAWSTASKSLPHQISMPPA